MANVKTSIFPTSRTVGHSGGQFTRADAEKLIAHAIDILDWLDAETEDREPEEDCCDAFDDSLDPILLHYQKASGAGDEVDAEDDDPAEYNGDESDNSSAEDEVCTASIWGHRRNN